MTLIWRRLEQTLGALAGWLVVERMDLEKLTIGLRWISAIWGKKESGHNVPIVSGIFSVMHRELGEVAW